MPKQCMLQASVKQNIPEPHVKSWQALEKWFLTTQAGPQFAALNGDINFIHLHPIVARLFGFKSNIAHGVYLVSKSIAAMQAGGWYLSHICVPAADAVHYCYWKHAHKQGAITQQEACNVTCLLSQAYPHSTHKLCQHHLYGQHFYLVVSHAAGSKEPPACPPPASSLLFAQNQQVKFAYWGNMRVAGLELPKFRQIYILTLSFFRAMCKLNMPEIWGHPNTVR